MSVAAQRPDRLPLLGVGVDRVTMQETLDWIDRFIRERGPHHVVTLDASMCVTAEEDPELKRIVREAALVTPDSAGVLWACRRMGQRLAQRVSGVEIVRELCALSARRGYRLFFLGAAPGVAAEAAERLKAAYPGCQIVGARDGFFKPEQERALVEEVRVSQPDVLCVAMGIPKQEKWIARHADDLRVPVMIGVGGTLDVFSGRVRRAPRVFQRLNLEWLYRLAMNPRKIGKVMTLPRFVGMALAQGHPRDEPARP